MLSRYIGDPDVIDHCGLVWGGLRPDLSLGRQADNVIIPLDLTQLFCPGFTLAGGPPSCFTTDIVGCWGEPCGEPAISLHSYTVALVQWSTRLLPIMRDPGSIPRGVLIWNQDFPVSIVSPHYRTYFTDWLLRNKFVVAGQPTNGVFQTDPEKIIHINYDKGKFPHIRAFCTLGLMYTV